MCLTGLLRLLCPLRAGSLFLNASSDLMAEPYFLGLLALLGSVTSAEPWQSHGSLPASFLQIRGQA